MIYKIKYNSLILKEKIKDKDFIEIYLMKEKIFKDQNQNPKYFLIHMYKRIILLWILIPKWESQVVSSICIEITVILKVNKINKILSLEEKWANKIIIIWNGQYPYQIGQGSLNRLLLLGIDEWINRWII